MSYLALRAGPALPTDAIWVAIGLEMRGHVLSVADGKLVVSEGSKLTAEDRAEIKQWRRHLMALLDYCREGHEPL